MAGEGSKLGGVCGEQGGGAICATCVRVGGEGWGRCRVGGDHAGACHVEVEIHMHTTQTTHKHTYTCTHTQSPHTHTHTYTHTHTPAASATTPGVPTPLGCHAIPVTRVSDALMLACCVQLGIFHTRTRPLQEAVASREASGENEQSLRGLCGWWCVGGWRRGEGGRVCHVWLWVVVVVQVPYSASVAP